MHLLSRVGRVSIVLLTAVPLALLGAGQANAQTIPVPCNGFGNEGASCTIEFSGSFGIARVSGNPDFGWVFVLNCGLFGGQHERGANPPSQGEGQSVLEWELGAPAASVSGVAGARRSACSAARARQGIVATPPRATRASRITPPVISSATAAEQSANSYEARSRTFR